MEETLRDKIRTLLFGLCRDMVKDGKDYWDYEQEDMLQYVLDEIISEFNQSRAEERNSQTDNG